MAKLFMSTIFKLLPCKALLYINTRSKCTSTNLTVLHQLLFIPSSATSSFTVQSHSSRVFFHLQTREHTENEMARSKQASSLIWVLVAGLLSQNLALTVMSTSLGDQKNFFFYPPSPDPYARSGTPPSSGSHSPSPPTQGSGGSYGGTPPSHGSGSSSGGPSHGSGGTSPSHGSGGSYGGTSPPHDPGSSGTGRTLTPPSHGSTNCGTPPHNSSPSTPSYTPTPTHNPTPSTPSVTFTPPPSHPFHGTCDYWRSHPSLIWSVVGWWGSLGSSFGSSLPGSGSSLSFPQALSNPRTDGLGALYREGTASLLNSMVDNKFPYTTEQVRNSFVAALGSDKAAAAQASLFKQANEGRL